MASGEEAPRRLLSSPSSSSSAGLEALFAAKAAERTDADGGPELAGLRERLQGWLRPYAAAVLWAQRLLVWERPLQSAGAAVLLHTAFWFLSSTALRPLFLTCVFLLLLVLLDRWRDRLPDIYIPVQCPEASEAERESMTLQPQLLSVEELSHHIAESYFICTLYVQEMLVYKRQNRGKFCVLMCSGCLVLAVIGHYVPGVMISYIILLSVLLWPLVVYHELIQKMYTGLEPILMKLDYSMKGDTQHRKHEKKKTKKETETGDEPQAETESESEEELSCSAPTVDVKTTALAMAITDSELSDEEASILESGGFSVSRATTPQLTDVSEDLDQQSLNSEPEETFSRDLPDFPSVEESLSPEHAMPPSGSPGRVEGITSDLQQEVLQSPASLLIQHLASPLHFVNTHFNGHNQPQGEGVSLSPEALSKEIVNTAISTVVQNTLASLLHPDETPSSPSVSESPPTESPPPRFVWAAQPTEGDCAVKQDDSDHPADMPTPADEEDFELLDQRELEPTGREQGLCSEGEVMDVRTPQPSDHTQES
ncbi:reticulophagy regulator 2-like [Scleropages formosus]|uniref:RETREG1-3/ARL6IP-like N-terminal reticulon-homology domain-containing protein n=1 Tax=Scleropages formosus TaxID=113540 RepID=A0A8C9SU85_SCLFO|nr:reticulophagy regulator 2-like [Scleropages formosus]